MSAVGAADGCRLQHGGLLGPGLCRRGARMSRGLGAKTAGFGIG